MLARFTSMVADVFFTSGMFVFGVAVAMIVALVLA